MSDSDEEVDVEKLKVRKSTINFLLEEQMKKLEKNDEEEQDLKLCYQKMKRLERDFEDLRKEIIDNLQLSEIREEIISDEETADKILKTFNKLDNLMCKKEDCVSEKKSKDIFMKMPKVDLPHYDGSVESYNSFMQQFNIAVNNNSQLSDVEKFVHLSTLLKGKASDIINGLQITSENYRIALELLEKKCGDTQIFIKRTIDELINLQKVKDLNHMFLLRTNVNKCLVNLRHLENSNINLQETSTVLTPILKGIFPVELRLQYEREFHDRCDIMHFINFIDTEIKLRERHLPTINLNPKAPVFSPRVPMKPPRIMMPPRLHSPIPEFAQRKPPWRGTSPFRPPLSATRASGVSAVSRCFNCQAIGHFKRDCPRLKKT